MDWLTWTYFFVRLAQNPAYYHLEVRGCRRRCRALPAEPTSTQGTTPDAISDFLSALVHANLHALADAGCLTIDGDAVTPTTNGRIASFYYLHFATMATFSKGMRQRLDSTALLRLLCAASEYDDLPVRHNEDVLNVELAKHVPVPVDARRCDDPHVKTELLLQAHMSRLPLPIADYATDTKAVLDNALRLLQAMVDVATEGGWLDTTLATMRLVQQTMQGRWGGDDALTTLPGVNASHAVALRRAGFAGLAALVNAAVGGQQRNAMDALREVC